jgi:hypothetical protein
MNPAIRASSADRERTVDVLKAAFAEGRLTQDEYDERMGAAYEARTYGDLDALVADLPVGPVPFQAAPFPPGPFQAGQVMPAPGWQMSPVPKTNGMAIAAAILGVAEFPTAGLTAIPALVCGHIARAQIRRTGERGTGAAAVGLIMGYIGVAFWAIALIATVLVAAAGGH